MLLMDKLMLFALGITCLTLVLLYIFIKGKFEVYDGKIDLLFNVYQKLAVNISQGPVKTITTCQDGMCMSRPIIVSDDDSDDSCSVDSESDEESEQSDIYIPDKSISQIYPELRMDKIIILNQEDEFDTRSVEEIKISKLDEELKEEILEVKEEVTEEVKEVKTNYSDLTLKELKQMVADVNGPTSLKTKKEMIQYLENR